MLFRRILWKLGTDCGSGGDPSTALGKRPNFACACGGPTRNNAKLSVVSRILLLVLFLVWLAWPGDQQWSAAEQWPWLVLFIGFYVLLVVLLGMWSRLLARRVTAHNFHQGVRRFNQTMFAARLVVPAWFAVGVWKLGWGPLIAGGIGSNLARMLPGVLLGTFPAFAAWMGLWWSQYPADRALREQTLLLDWENDLPLHQPPPFRSYFSMNLRLQVLFTVVPVLMIVATRDLMMLGATRGLHWTGDRLQPRAELLASVVAAALVFLLAPEVLRRVLRTTPLPPSPLRMRLEFLCERAGIRYREILLWQTQNNVGNAAVMGVLPWMRYVLLSDVLLERMTDDEIEAVFAHELGHIVHRHMSWYAVFFIVLILLMMALADAIGRVFPTLDQSTNAGVMLMLMAGTGIFLLLFGALSRCCERQADVYAARTMEATKGPLAAAATAAELLLDARQIATVGVDRPQAVAKRAQTSRMPVGPHGANLFSAALRRVAAINNIPIRPRRVRLAPEGSGSGGGGGGAFRPLPHVNQMIDSLVDMANHWFHGSIAARMDYLQSLATDSRLTTRFDRAMTGVYAALLFALVIAGVLGWAMQLVW
jgi:Zn-dependent protease with chaperone function